MCVVCVVCVLCVCDKSMYVEVLLDLGAIMSLVGT